MKKISLIICGLILSSNVLMADWHACIENEINKVSKLNPPKDIESIEKNCLNEYLELSGFVDNDLNENTEEGKSNYWFFITDIKRSYEDVLARMGLLKFEHMGKIKYNDFQEKTTMIEYLGLNTKECDDGGQALFRKYCKDK